jgi:hypothetical protein
VSRRAKAWGTAPGQPRFTECLHHPEQAKRAWMTQGLTIVTRRYPAACAGARQACRLASSPNVGNTNNAWNVNNNNRNNNNAVRLVRASQWRA